MSRSRRARTPVGQPDKGRRRFLLATPALLAGAWLAGAARRFGVRSEAPPRHSPRLLSLDQADLYGPHNLAG